MKKLKLTVITLIGICILFPFILLMMDDFITINFIKEEVAIKFFVVTFSIVACIFCISLSNI